MQCRYIYSPTGLFLQLIRVGDCTADDWLSRKLSALGEPPKREEPTAEVWSVKFSECYISQQYNYD